MTDKELIEEAREWSSSYASWGDNGLVDRLVDALEAATGRARQAEAELRDMLRVDIPSLKAERDAAVVAIERCRGVLAHWEARQAHNREILGSGGLGHFQAIDCTGDLRAALDGAPEPEWEWGCDTGMGDEPRAHSSLASAESDASGVSRREYPDGRVEEFSRHVMRRRKAGPWLPVEGERK